MAEQILNVLAFLSIVLAASVFFLIRRVYWHPLSRFPGPILPAVTSFYQFGILWKGQEGPWYRSLHQEYGPIVRCGPNHLSFNDPALVPIVYHRKVDKTNFHQEFSCPAAVFNQKNHLDHAAAKRRFGFAYALSNIKARENVLDEQIQNWITVLNEQAKQSTRVDFELWARFFSFDAITALSFGDAVGFLDAKEDVRGLISNMEKSMYRQKLSLYPPISWFARHTALGRWMFVAQGTDNEGLGLFIAEVHKRIQERVIVASKASEKLNSGKSMLDQWLSTRTTNGEPIPAADIQDQILMDMLAGPDSISLMATNLMFLLVAHPNVLKRVRQEIDEAMQVQGLSAPVPSYDECRRLPFVDACVREGLRFIASTFPRRRCSEVPLYLAGRYVPPGTSIATSACEIGRHKDVYGEDADEFAPERWLRAPVEKLRQWETLDVHWGFGVRKCLGKHIGLMALYKSTVLMLQKFDLQLMEGTGIGLWSYPSTTVMQMAPRASSAM